ncbi:MAG: HD domain-containing protein [Candidatus Heimdallarchaeota archaeon]|nr:MAG: HD domain-containing protein [Candidatus Heimdallarchaeota archaeon]
MFTRALTEKEQEILLRIQEFVRRCHAESDSHDYSHVFMVTRTAIQISKNIDDPIDPFIVIAGSLLHDIGKTTNDFAGFHGLFGGSIAEEFLEGLEIENSLSERICRVVVRHTPTSSIPPVTPEEKVVYDADTLDRLGLMGLLRGFIGKEGSMQEILEKYMTSRQQDYEKLNYEYSRELGMMGAQELEGFSHVIQKRLDDRMSSITAIFEKEGLINKKAKVKKRKKKKS